MGNMKPARLLDTRFLDLEGTGQSALAAVPDLGGTLKLPALTYHFSR